MVILGAHLGLQVITMPPYFDLSRRLFIFLPQQTTGCTLKNEGELCDLDAALADINAMSEDGGGCLSGQSHLLLFFGADQPRMDNATTGVLQTAL